jgi:hypothetical protein
MHKNVQIHIQWWKISCLCKMPKPTLFTLVIFYLEFCEEDNFYRNYEKYELVSIFCVLQNAVLILSIKRSLTKLWHDSGNIKIIPVDVSNEM